MRPVLQGHVDAPVTGDVVERGRLVVRGWHFFGTEPALAVAVTVTCGQRSRTVVVPVGGEERPDVAKALEMPALAASGWRAVLDTADLVEAGEGATATVEVTVWGALGAPPSALPPIGVVLLRVAQGEEPADEREPAPEAALMTLDVPESDAVPRDWVPVSGWCLLGRGLASTVELFVNGEPVGRARLGLDRHDLGLEWSDPLALVCGFGDLVDLSSLSPATRWVHLLARATDPATGARASAERWLELAAPSPDGPATAAASRLGPSLDEVAVRRAALVADARSSRKGRSGAGGSSVLNLAVFSHSLGLGGGQLWLTEMLRRAGAGSRFPCTVYAPEPGPLAGELESSGIEVEITPDAYWRGRAAYEGRVTELSLLLAARGHDVVLANTVLSLAGADAGLAAGCPVVWAIHESWSPAAIWPGIFPRGAVDTGVRRRFEEVVAASSALVFAADSTRALYERVGAPGRSVVVPYGIDVASVDRYLEKVSRAEAREMLGIPDGSRLLLAMGTIEPRKGQTMLAAAFGSVAADHPEARLALVGGVESSYTRALGDLVARSPFGDRIEVVPMVEDTYTWYRASDVLVSASDIESLPRTILEAMCFGLPVLATSVFGVPELLSDGDNGYLFRTKDLAALEAALQRVLAEEPSKLAAVGARARDDLRAGFDSSEYALDMMLILEGLRADPHALPGDLLARADRHPERRLRGLRPT
jgi:D-inositol-3-phosphate glycosyltransferase